MDAEVHVLRPEMVTDENVGVLLKVRQAGAIEVTDGVYGNITPPKFLYPEASYCGLKNTLF